MSQDLVAYIQSARAKGISDDAIRSIMYNMNYDRSAVDAAFQTLSGGVSVVSAPTSSVSPVSSATVATTTSATPSGFGKKKVIAIVVAVVLLLGVGGTFAFFQVFNMSPRTAQVLARTMTNMSQMHSFKYDLDIALDFNVEIEEDSYEEIYGEENFGEDAGTISMIQNGTHSFNFSGAVDRLESFQTTLVLSSSSTDFTGSMSLEARLAGGELFGQIVGVQGMDLVAGFVSPYQGQWILFDSLERESDFDTDTYSRMNQVFWKHIPFMLSTFELPSAELGGKDYLRYAFKLDKEDALVNFYRELASVAEIEFDEAEARSAAADAIAWAKDIDSEMWIDKENLVIYKISMIGPYDTSETSSFKVSGKTSVSLVLSAINEPVSIVAPQGAKPLSEIIDSIFEGVSDASSGL